MRRALAAGRRPVLLIGGPSASGKSALALAVAEEFGGLIINADSMQLYREIPILSGQPSAAERARQPHRLYGVLDAADAASAARWQALASAAIGEAHAAGRLPIVVGGTGLYFEALRKGLAPVPAIPPALRAEIRARFTGLGADALHAALAVRDARMAAILRPTDTQRMMRALEVIEGTGRSLADWQDDGQARAPDWPDCRAIVLDPPRAAVYAACGARFEAMMASGAVDEVRALLARGLDPGLPAMKALGVRELAAHVAGMRDRAAAVEDAVGATRRYTKRQMTWFRHHLPDAHRLFEQFSESMTLRIFPFIRQFLLTEAG